MKTILSVINLGEEFLKKRGIERARREAEELIAEALSVHRIDLYLNFERPLLEKEWEICLSFFKRRATREPFQYIAGYVNFSGVKIKVAPSVLIPRAETEILVEKITQELEKSPSLEGKVLWDMCTGSGCIGIALKKRFPALSVFLSDVSSEALQIAQENAAANCVEVTVLQGDLFEPLGNKSIDFFIANPPYITEKEYLDLQIEVRRFEPKLALVGGEDGLLFYKAIAEKLPHYLSEQGKAWLEIGSSQKDAVLSFFQKNYGSKCFVEKDWSGQDRFLRL